MRACSSNSRFKASVRFVFVALFSSRGQETIFLTYRYCLLKTMQIGKMDRLGTGPQLFRTDVPCSQRRHVSSSTVLTAPCCCDAHALLKMSPAC